MRRACGSAEKARVGLTELLLDDFEDLFLVELLGEALDRGQRLTSIALWR